MNCCENEAIKVVGIQEIFDIFLGVFEVSLGDQTIDF
jgi:hypothetical protein